MENRKIFSTLPGTKTRFLGRAASTVATIVTISCVRSYKYRVNINIIKDDMLTQYDSRHNQHQESVQLKAGTRHTHDKPKHSVLFTYSYAVLTETISFHDAYRHIRTFQRLSFGIPVS